MPPSILRQRRVQLPLAAPHPIPLRLTMANDQEATHSEPHKTILTTGQPTRRIDCRYVGESPRERHLRSFGRARLPER